jgi:hypothetical protein
VPLIPSPSFSRFFLPNPIWAGIVIFRRLIRFLPAFSVCLALALPGFIVLAAASAGMFVPEVASRLNAKVSYSTNLVGVAWPWTAQPNLMAIDRSQPPIVV